MRLIVRLMLIALAVLGAVRSLAYLVDAGGAIPSPYELFPLEGKMVLLAYRVQHGLSWYPAWRDYPHVVNAFAPLYFGLVGLLGRVCGADVPGLYFLGRLVTFGSGMLTSAAVTVYVARQYGRGAAVASAALALGSLPMVGFGMMVRPDMTAEFLGVTGYLLGTSRSVPGRRVGFVLLVLAMLTKQTAVVFVAAAGLALWIEGERRRAVGTVLGSAVVVAGIVALTTVLVEPNFASGLFEESGTPWSRRAWAKTIADCVTLSPDLPFFAALGGVLWMMGRPREPRMAVLAVLVTASALLASAKVGSGANYYMTLRVVEALAVGKVWRLAGSEGTRLRGVGLALAAGLGCVALLPSVEVIWGDAASAWRSAGLRQTAAGREQWKAYERVIQLAADPRMRILTDSAYLESWQGERAAFGDPWLFRLMVDTGRIHPTKVEEWIEAEAYDAVVTMSDVQLPGYLKFESTLPRPLVERVRKHYVPLIQEADFYVYGRRGATAPLLLRPR